jgi:4-amino-4-deoxy-L-arabinose transferase-like glycosyltransferase
MSRLPALLAIALVLAVVGLWWFWSPPSANDLVSGDEGYYGVMARNIAASPRFLVNPSLWPQGPPGDKPPLYPALLAVSLRLFGVGENAVRGPSYAFAALSALALAFVLRRPAGAWAAVGVAVLLVTLPWFADASRGAAAEVPTTLFGLLALAVLVPDPSSRRRALAAGSLLGLAFLCKLWLVAPFVLAAIALVGFGTGSRGALALLLAGAAGTGALHGLSVLAFSPGTKEHWLQIYFGRSLLERAAGEVYVGGWVKHPAYYWALLVHATALMFPLACAGVEASVRRFREPVPRAMLVWAACVGLLSAFSVKTGIYAYVVLPAWVALAAIGAQALASGLRPSIPTIALGLIASTPWLIPGEAGQRLQWPIWAATWAVALTAWFGAARRVRWAPMAAAGLVVIAAAGGLVREAQRLPIRYNETGLRVLAQTVDTLVAGAPAGRISFVAPEAPALAFYLDRTGTYWRTPQVPWSSERGERFTRNDELRFFVVDTTDRLYGGSPDSSTTAWLERTTVEITDRFEARLGRKTPLRVYAR